MIFASLFVSLLLMVGADNSHPNGLKEILDVDTKLKHVLSMLFDNNIELTKRAIKMVDSIPSDGRNCRHALNFIKSHYSKGVKIWLSVGSGSDPIKLDNFMDSQVSPSRVVLSMYLTTLIHLPVSSPPPEFELPNGLVSYNVCAQIKPKTFLNCCPSSCEPCEKYPEIPPDHTNVTTTTTIRKGHNELEAARFKRNPHSGQPPESWFFEETEMRQFQKIIDGSDYHFGNLQVVNNFDRFLITMPLLEASQLPDEYYENMLALLASLGISVGRSRYEQFARPHENPTESGFLGLISRLTLLARQFRPRMRDEPCRVPNFCQLSACPIDGALVRSSPLTPPISTTSSISDHDNDNDIECLWCSY